jgi:subtilisin family serine protease
MSLLVIAGMAMGLAAQSVTLAQPAAPAKAPEAAKPASTQPKLPVKTADDLPRYTYKIEGKASDFIKSDKPFREFAAKIKADAESDLAKYDITDPTTLKEYYGLLQGVAALEGRWDEVLGYIEKVRAIEQKESKKLMTGSTVIAYTSALKVSDNGKDKSKLEAAFKSALDKRVSALPWDIVREEVTQTKGRADIMRPELVYGSIQGQLDPVVEQAKGELSNDLARGLINMRFALDVMIPLMPSVSEVYGKIIDSHKTVAKDIWAERAVTLTEKDKATPVVVCIWDSGTDVAIFKDRLWVNKNETVNGKDDDGNGFIDDVNGIAYDLDAKPVPALLSPIDGLKSDLKTAMTYTKGLGDLSANIDSAEKKALIDYMKTLPPEKVTPFTEDLGLYGQYSHGTHVAGIAQDGNPFARLLPCRIEFDYRAIPLNAPSVAQATKEAKAARDSVAYMKKAGVRVVNMSWGGSRKDIEDSLEKKGVGKTTEERAAMSREIFKIQRDALEAAIKGAPEILFVAAAGNSDNNNTFAEFIPSGLILPNMITVGAVDQSGKPTGFTTFGENVKFYANGFEVESYVPGGQRMKYSGTSMAAPNTTNLAAKLFALNPKLTVEEVINLITTGGDPMNGDSKRLLINPKKSVELMTMKK